MLKRTKSTGCNSPIIVITHDFPPYSGGISRHLADICQFLPAERLTVVAPKLPDCNEFDERIDYRVVRVTTPSGSSKIDRIKEILALYRDFRRIAPKNAKVIFGHLWVGLMALFPQWRWKYAQMLYGGEFLEFGSNPLFRRVSTTCSLALPISNHTATECQKWGIPENRIYLINPGLNFSRLAVNGKFPWQREERKELVLVTVGRLHRRKGHIFVIEVLSRLRTRFPHLKYLIAGNGEMRPILEQRAGELGVKDLVDFLGFVPDKDLAKVYENADIFVMPSMTDAKSTEGFGIVYLEANYFGLPVIGFASGGVTDAVINGETGLLVPPGDLAELEKALITLIENKELRFRLGQQGRRRVLHEFDAQKIAKRLLEKIDEM
ncbi:MAG: glycosyltransferase family 4 protein [candidate division WOR-3 bacterium]